MSEIVVPAVAFRIAGDEVVVRGRIQWIRGDVQGREPAVDEGQISTPAGSVLAPQRTTTTCSASSGTYTPRVNAAKAVAPPYSTTTLRQSQSARRACTIESSETSRLLTFGLWASSYAMRDARRAPRESAAIESTGMWLSATAAAMPENRPPPPTATMIVSTSGTCARTSAATVPAPAAISALSYARESSAPDSRAYSIDAARASAYSVPTRRTSAP